MDANKWCGKASLFLSGDRWHNDERYEKFPSGNRNGLKVVANMWTTSTRLTSRTLRLITTGIAARKNHYDEKVATQIFKRVLWQNEKDYMKKRLKCCTVFDKNKEKVNSFIPEDKRTRTKG